MATVTLRGKPLDTIGNPPNVGDTAPAFELIGNDMSPVKLSDTDGKIRIISVVPAIDTRVCSLQTARFNHDLDSLPDSVVGYTISVDTPLAQSNWCAAKGVEKMELLSDARGDTFGRDWGLYLQDPGFLARSVFVVDKEGKIAYAQIVPEISEEPDYEAALTKAKELAV
ncbi:thiol peroxidase [Abditibacteriota bacterium]|nr:thiol peroxidase [Abditibacteriota bacterium]